MNWIGQHFYGNPPDPYHQGRLTEKDAEFIKDFLLAQEYIDDFGIMDPKTTMITHNLDRFRPLFTRHPANYIRTYCMAFNIDDEDTIKTIEAGPWLTVPNPKKIEGKPYIVNKSLRGFAPPGCNPMWTKLKDEGIDEQSVFIGLPEEHDAFQKLTGWKVDHYPTKTMLDLAEVIAGCEKYYGNMSVSLSIAQGLRVPYAFETRRDLPMERNEANFPTHTDGSYF